MMKTKQKNSNSTKKAQDQSIMSRNVTTFRHLLKNSHINGKDIKWTVNLRSYAKSTLLIKQIQRSSPPQVFYKETQLQKIRKNYSAVDSNYKSINIGEFEHFSKKSLGGKYSKQEIDFHSSLGNSNNKNSKNQYGQVFSPLPKRKESGYPKILKKTSQNLKKITKQNEQTTFDGHQNYPKYSQKIVKQKNIAQWKHFTQGRVNLPNLAWHVGLRNY